MAWCLIYTGGSGGNICINHQNVASISYGFLLYICADGQMLNTVLPWYHQNLQKQSTEFCVSRSENFLPSMNFCMTWNKEPKKSFSWNEKENDSAMRRYWLLIFLTVFVGEGNSIALVTPVLLYALFMETDIIIPLTDWSMIMSATAKLTC